ncbi:head GIN domain-containing protein [Mesonia maritima]|uniref:Putative auto-transporter adhesin head GIN domain-containing protein n=1 Tax=Mesonia maritima TaxID=1793873 RepID=A0ABU1K2E8_9FLAO|nr:head GIN domain-containing protein [Mesonia maritima]MDR6299784.1 hypothetical protein [Mesonia maritima]
MKTYILLVISLLSLQAFAQEIEIKIEEDFNEIKIFNKINATLIPSTENKIIAKGVEKEEVEAKVHGNVLKIKSELDNIWSEDDTQVEIYYKSFEILDINEGAEVDASKIIKQENLTVSAQEGSRIALEIEVKNLKVKIYTGGSIYLYGKADQQEVSIKAGGEYEGKELITQSTNVKVSAGGDAEVNASESCNAKVSAGGSIYVYGNPSELNQKTTFGGKIVKKEE